MLFNSIHFLFFFLITTTIYYLLPHSKRWILLLACSCYFYMAFVPIYIIILGVTIVIDYYAAIWIEKVNIKKKKLFLILSLIANIGILAIFKYHNFFNENFSILLKGFGLNNPIPYLNILLPIGLSFHTFQAMSYTLEVYRGNQKAEKHFGIYSLYVMFYPQLVAGPIERPQNILYQLRKKIDFNYEKITSGLRLMGWGIFKKVVIADRLAVVVDHVFNHPTSFNSLSLIIASIFFSFQIYCDFSGYSDVALGTARVLGIELMQNFNLPYHSKTIKEFWSKWHISLSTWFRDYLYIPLGGNRVNKTRWYFNILIIFIFSGFWHGANWTFIVWGVLHGFFQIFGFITEKYRKKSMTFFKLDNVNFLSLVSTFLLVNFAWIYFRAKDLNTAHEFIFRLFSKFTNLLYQIKHGENIIENLGVSNKELILCFFLIILLESFHFLIRKYSIHKLFLHFPSYIRWIIYLSVIISIIFFGTYEERQFIYFQF